MWATSLIFKKQPKVNNRTLGENSAKSGHPALQSQFISSPREQLSSERIDAPLPLLGRDSSEGVGPGGWGIQTRAKQWCLFEISCWAELLKCYRSKCPYRFQSFFPGFSLHVHIHNFTILRLLVLFDYLVVKLSDALSIIFFEIYHFSKIVSHIFVG
jgi:hypothetical protein